MAQAEIGKYARLSIEIIESSPEIASWLESIGPVIGIDVLNPRNPRAFGDGNLTVIYGINGSGESGYARIISRACGKPHSVALRPNVYEGAPVKQECDFSYKSGGALATMVWSANSDPIDIEGGDAEEFLQILV